MKRKNALLAAVAFIVAFMIIMTVQMILAAAKADKPVVLSKSEKATEEKVVMPELEIPAAEQSVMNDAEIEKWHRFCCVYSDAVPLSADDQLALFEACEEFEVDYFLMLGLINKETHFQNLIGDGGESFGYCQIQPKWWTGKMQEIGAQDLMTAKDNFRTACAIIKEMFCRYGCGNLTDVLTGYNANHGGNSEYAEEVISYQESWQELILQ